MTKNFKFQISNFKLSNKGFTLMEILVAVAIIGVLSSLLMVNFISLRQRGRDSQRKSNLAQIQSALEIYRADNGKYPTVSSLVNCPPTFGNTSCTVTYMQKIPTDPLGGAYVYSPSGDGTTYSLIACLENANDGQIDKDSNGLAQNCSGSTNLWRYTATNP